MSSQPTIIAKIAKEKNFLEFVSLYHYERLFNCQKRYAMHLRWLFILMQNRKNNVEAITIIITTDTNIEADERAPGQMEKNHPLTTEDIDDTPLMRKVLFMILEMFMKNIDNDMNTIYFP